MQPVTKIWSLYEKGVDRHAKMRLDSETEKAYRFFEGDQWRGLEAGENLPVYNFIAPTVRHKVASVALNQMSIYFSAPYTDADREELIRKLNTKVAQWWEQNDMDTVCRTVLKESAVAGDSYVYMYDGGGHCQIIDNVNVFLADETEPDIQKQPYIILYERQPVEKVRAAAARNGVAEQEIQKILSDTALTAVGGEDDGKCGCILYMEKKQDGVYFSRHTKYVTLSETKCIKGLGRYPIASLITCPVKGSARGKGEVLPLIPNQIEVNRNLARRIINAKLTAFSRLVYAADKIDDPEQLEKVGSAIAVDGSIASVNDAVGYVTPSPMSSDAKIISDELLLVTKELAGAGNAATGNVDPTQASGAAIIAVRDQAQITLDENVAIYRKFAEDIARIWYAFEICYHKDQNGFSKEQLLSLRPSIRIDATSVTPFSKYAREEALQKLFESGTITFEEYVGALDDDASVPRGKLLKIIKMRKAGEVCNL